MTEPKRFTIRPPAGGFWPTLDLSTLTDEARAEYERVLKQAAQMIADDVDRRALEEVFKAKG